jgi:cell wall-associated NlpC family hydrolase
MTRKTVALMGLLTAFSFFFSLENVSAQAMVRPRRAPEQSMPTQQPVKLNAMVVPAAQTPQNQPLVKSGAMTQPTNRPTLTNDIYVRPTAAVKPANAATSAALNAASSSMAAFRSKMFVAMNAWMGTPYGYGSEGPGRIDCSALVWRVFNAAGINFERTSARNYWNDFAVATDEEKTQFGTLVFFNSLGHVGIVIDENTFYHASSSKGVTISSFKGYWGKRIVGYRRIPLNQLQPLVVPAENSK